MSVDLTTRILNRLRRGPATAREIADSVGSTRSEVNTVLYRRTDLFDRVMGNVPNWVLLNSDAASEPAAAPPLQGSIGVTEAVLPKSKKDALAAILAAAGSRADLVLGPGSTEPKALFVEVNRHLDLGLDESLSKVALARLITRHAGLRWPSNGDSEDSPSGGGDTVTLTGLQTVLAAVRLIAAANGPRASEPAVESPSGEYREASGGIDAPPRELVEDWNALDSATRRHADLQNRIAAEVRGAGLDPLSPRPDQPQFDIAWEAAGRFVVCEVKSTNTENAIQQVRLGLGQVLEYRRALADDHPTVVAAVACEVLPAEATRRALTAVGVRIVCSDTLTADLVPLL